MVVNVPPMQYPKSDICSEFDFLATVFTTRSRYSVINTSRPVVASSSLTVPQPSTRRLTPLLCKEGRGEVEGPLLYPTSPPLTKGREIEGPLTKGRRQLRVRVSGPFMNNPG